MSLFYILPDRKELKDIYRSIVAIFTSLVILSSSIVHLTKMTRSTSEVFSENNNSKVEIVQGQQVSRNERRLRKNNNIAFLLKSFDVQRNLKSILSTKCEEHSFSSIHGLRSIAVALLIFFHIYYYATAVTDNQQFTFTYSGSIFLQPMYSAVMSVDTFFVLSGFLLAFNFYEQQARNPSTNVLARTTKRICTRYLRLNLCFLIVIKIID